MLLHNYLWAKMEHTIHGKIKWKDCYVVLKIGGLGLAGLKEALINLLTKWVMYALQHGFFNVLILLGYHLGSTRPNKTKNGDKM